MYSPSIPADELAALYQARAYLGRRAKACIRNAWKSGDYSAFPPYINTAALQRYSKARHGGPSGLDRLFMRAA